MSYKQTTQLAAELGNTRQPSHLCMLQSQVEISSSNLSFEVQRWQDLNHKKSVKHEKSKLCTSPPSLKPTHLHHFPGFSHQARNSFLVDSMLIVLDALLGLFFVFCGTQKKLKDLILIGIHGIRLTM